MKVVGWAFYFKRINAVSCECKSLATGLTFEKICVKVFQVQNTCNEQQKKKYVDRWLKQIVQEYTR